MRRLIPTKSQFFNWSLPSRASYIAFAIAVLGVPLLILLYWETIWSALSSLGPVQVKLESAVGSEIQFSVSNPKRRHVVIHDAYLVAIFPPAYEDDFEQLRVSAFGHNGQRSPVIIEKHSTAIVQVNKQSLSPIPDMGHWALAYHEYYQEYFLWSLARNNDTGSFFTCAIYLSIDDASPIVDDDFHADDPRLRQLDCHVMLAITGEFSPYHYGNEKYTEDPPRRPGERRRGR